MTKKLLFFLPFLFISCEKIGPADNSGNNSQNSNEFTEGIIATATSFKSKNTEFNGVDFNWDLDDNVGILTIDGGDNNYRCSIKKIGKDKHNTLLNPNSFTLNTGDKYAAYYPYLASSYEYISFLLTHQYQKGNNNTSHLRKCDIQKSRSAVYKDGTIKFELNHSLSIVRLKIQIKQKDTFCKLIIKCDDMWNSFKPRIYKASALFDNGYYCSKYMEIFLDNIEVNSGEDLIVWFAMPPTQRLDGKYWNITAVGQDSVQKGQAGPLCEFEEGYAYSFDVSAVAEQRPKQLIAVDLGLSVKWASYNVGAIDESDGGNYYAWAEISPKESYSESNYKWCNGTMSYLTKYTKNQYGERILEEDDVASQIYGNGWRMPSENEFKELQLNTNLIDSERDGRKGVLLISKKNSNSIFIPLCGAIDGDRLYDFDETSYLWDTDISSNYLTGQFKYTYDCKYGSMAIATINYYGVSFLTASGGLRRNQGGTVRAVHE